MELPGTGSLAEPRTYAYRCLAWITIKFSRNADSCTIICVWMEPTIRLSLEESEREALR